MGKHGSGSAPDDEKAWGPLPPSVTSPGGRGQTENHLQAEDISRKHSKINLLALVAEARPV